MNRALVVDVEATCWKNRQPPQGEQSEIIEIGICALDLDSLEPGPAHSILVKPQRSKISPFCTHLTSITPGMVAQGVLFDEACTRLRCDFASGDGIWTSWGHFDRRIFERQCRNFDVAYPFSDRHVNLKKRLAILLRGNRKGKPRQISLMRALDMMNLNFVGAKHRAGSDTWNTARLLVALIEQYGQDRVLG